MKDRIYLYCQTSLAVFKRISAVSFFVVLLSFSIGAQTTNISGIVNTYHKVVEIIASKACIRVANITGLDVNSRVMLIQMKGASIITTNNSAFGDTTSLNEAGNYEIGTVCYIIGDSVFLFHNLLNSYNTSTGKVQLVQFAEYYSANVIDTVKGASWDSVASTGGVIAIFADQNLTLNAPIYADSSGYRGGSFLQSNGTCSDAFPANSYVYNPSATTPQNGAYKGENVATLTIAQSGGRGAPANGGGGGNNHNNSGGGGANLNTGGIGGGNSSSGVACTAIRRGEAGKAMKSWNGQKIFMGGGGGAGHSNNGLTVVSGGNGGGLIFIWANNLIGNGNMITAKGGNGGNSQSDGAGGGGGGGTIIMHLTNYTGAVSVIANGGSGGGSDDGLNLNRCFGGGGGGSGGVIYFTDVIPAATITVNGGSAGIEINRDASCNPVTQDAAPGSNGQIIPNYTFSRSTDPAGYCLLLLPSQLHHFTAQLINRSVELKWDLDQPELVKNFMVEKKMGTTGWTTLANIDASDNRLNYLAADPHPFSGNNFYRLKVIEKTNSIYFSETRKVWVDLFNQDFTIYPNPAIDKVFVLGKFEAGKMFRIMDIAGKIIWKQELHNNLSTIELPRLPAGLYLVLYNGKTKKLVIR